jgi:predicted nucleic acid-binding protein
VDLLIDTSIWSLGFRRDEETLSRDQKLMKAELMELIREGRARMIGPVRQELLSGIREEAQYIRIRGVLRAFEDESLVIEDYELAARFSNQCRTGGISGSGVDFLICAVAHLRYWEVFTSDLDFPTYARRIPIRLHVPRARNLLQ